MNIKANTDLDKCGGRMETISFALCFKQKLTYELVYICREGSTTDTNFLFILNSASNMSTESHLCSIQNRFS